ncbi:hypothetical protein [Lutispora thermophila]|uniref:Uncharacterized protein n=1 Tax=Lutispora thermophila DSM 19022 TaxID=1122184 RepID=A0A1M6EJ09_9FIRM|nr:hypothetical protein [Lutispora thermophila]SHI85443.1 hypothetical protein SAMN02745176_01590 [Lutispora thermophila DSM 19022]
MALTTDNDKNILMGFMICMALLPMTVQAAEPFTTKLEAPTNVVVNQAP